jgi:dihydrofolate reductase
MRKVVLQMQISLDGFVGRPNGDVDWIFRSFDEEFTAWSVDSLWQADVHIMGSVTGRGLAEYWPSTNLEKRDEPFAPAMNQIPKVVFSKTLARLEWNATRIARGDLVDEIVRLKEEPGKRILAHGGARFAQSLSKLRLIDEYELVIHPVVLGRGLSLFPEFSEPFNLDLLETRTFRSGAVLHVYRPV